VIRFSKTSFALAALAFSVLTQPAAAQAPNAGDDTLSWTATIANAETVKPGARIAVQLRGVLRDGWHVYGLKQAANGPTPLLVSLAANANAVTAGPPSATPPIEEFDPSFDLKTQYYAKDFTVTAPVKVSAQAAAGPQVIPVDVRYQTCNGKICHIPRTVRLTATVNVQR
jgi:DsbC/DsbD-like thiol-disulfide interchange protein